jgi:hypothetical protein
MWRELAFWLAVGLAGFLFLIFVKLAAANINFAPLRQLAALA